MTARAILFSLAAPLGVGLLAVVPPGAQAQTRPAATATRPVALPPLPPRATQTMRGTVLDAAAKAPVIGATVVVVGATPALGASTNASGRFRLPGVPVGRVRLRVLALGYEDLLLNEVTVTSGKEVVLDLGLTERLTKLDEVQVTYKRTDDARVTNNEMATVSARPFSPLDANCYAGSCIVPECGGVLFGPVIRQKLGDRYPTAAPAHLRQYDAVASAGRKASIS